MRRVAVDGVIRLRRPGPVLRLEGLIWSRCTDSTQRFRWPSPMQRAAAASTCHTFMPTLSTSTTVLGMLGKRDEAKMPARDSANAFTGFVANTATAASIACSNLDTFVTGSHQDNSATTAFSPVLWWCVGPLICTSAPQTLVTGGEVARPHFHKSEHCGTSPSKGDDTDRPPSDYELSLGKIIDTLRRDYPDFFVRAPDCDIYDEKIVFELGRPFHGVAGLKGKKAYAHALGALQRLGKSTILDSKVSCRIADGSPYGHALRVSWACQGHMLWFHCPIHIAGVSLYRVTPQSHGTDKSTKEGRPSMSHRVSHHTLEFVEIHPPTLRSVLLRQWWQPQHRLSPVLALEHATWANERITDFA